MILKFEKDSGSVLSIMYFARKTKVSCDIRLQEKQTYRVLFDGFKSKISGGNPQANNLLLIWSQM